MATYGNYAAAGADRYKGRVAAYEVWNEPNAIMFWATGAKGPDAELFIELLKSAYPRIKDADPGAAVVAGGLGPVIDFFSFTVNPVKFVERMYAAGAKGNSVNSPMNLVKGMRQTMVNNGDGGNKIWGHRIWRAHVEGRRGHAGGLPSRLHHDVAHARFRRARVHLHHPRPQHR